MEEKILQNGLLLSYLHSKMAVKNLELCVHEMNMSNHKDAGKLQHRFEKLINAHRKAMGILEKNIQDKALLESDIENQLDENWSKLD